VDEGVFRETLLEILLLAFEVLLLFGTGYTGVDVREGGRGGIGGGRGINAIESSRKFYTGDDHPVRGRR
jgi:hypothetical protein